MYAVYADRFELLQVNNEYYHVTGCNSIDLRERQTGSRANVHPDDLPSCKACSPKAYERPVTGAEATFRRYRLNGEIMWMRMRAFFLRREQDRTIFFASLADVTEQKQQEDELRESQAVLELEDEVLHRIIQQSDLNVWVYDIASDRLSFQNLSSNGIASLLAASADEEDTASLGDDVSNVLRRLSRETLWGRPAARTIKVWSNTGEPLTLHIEREIVPDANGKPARVIGYLEDPLNDSRAKLTRSDDNRLLDILKGAAVDHWYINVNTKSFLNSADRRAWRYWAGISLDDWSSSMLEDRLGNTSAQARTQKPSRTSSISTTCCSVRRRRAQQLPRVPTRRKSTMNAGWTELPHGAARGRRLRVRLSVGHRHRRTQAPRA